MAVMCVSNDYWTNVSSNMASLRDQGLYCDLQIECEGQTLNVHKVVMAAGIDYFRNMLNSEMLEARNNKVELEGFPFFAVKEIVNFAYSGYINLNEKIVGDVLLASNFLLVEEIQERCVEYLRGVINEENCFRIRELASLSASEKLGASVDSYVIDNFENVYSNPDIGIYSMEEFFSILDSNYLKVKTENQVMIAVINWVLYDLQYRSKYLHMLLEKIRILYLDYSALIEVIDGIPDQSLRASLEQYLVVHESSPHSSSQLSRYYPSGVIVCLGGRKDRPNPCEFVEVYSPRLDKWMWNRELPFAGRQVGVTVIGHRVYMIGGHNGRKMASSSGVLDVKTGEYTYLPQMPFPRRGMGVTQLHNRYVYAIGGTDEAFRQSFAEVQRYDTEKNVWELVANMNMGRRNVNAMAIDGRIYAIGGCVEETTLHVNTVEAYDQNTDMWVPVAPMNVSRYSAGATFIGHRLYVMGGFGNDGALKDCEYYDTTTDSWHSIAPLNTARGGVGVDTMGGRIYAVGGYNGKYLKSAEVYDPVTDTWTYCASMHDSRAGCGVAHVELVEDDVAPAVYKDMEMNQS